MKIKYARLHSSTFAPGLGNIKDTLDSNQFSTLSMVYSDSVLSVTAKKQGMAKAVTFMVPLPALALMVPEEQ